MLLAIVHAGVALPIGNSAGDGPTALVQLDYNGNWLSTSTKEYE